MESDCPRWLFLPTERLLDYDIHKLYKCPIHLTEKVIKLVHEEGGDYTCFNCDESCKIVYVCFDCSYNKKKRKRR